MFFFRWKVTAPVLTFRSCKEVSFVDLCRGKARRYLDVDLVSTKNNGNVLADTFEITMPIGDVLIGDTGSDVEHDDTALALNIVTITETTKLLLTSGVPHIEADRAIIRCEG